MGCNHYSTAPSIFIFFFFLSKQIIYLAGGYALHLIWSTGVFLIHRIHLNHSLTVPGTTPILHHLASPLPPPSLKIKLFSISSSVPSYHFFYISSSVSILYTAVHCYFLLWLLIFLSLAKSSASQHLLIFRPHRRSSDGQSRSHHYDYGEGA